MSGIEPKPGFDWSKVKWGAPTDRTTEHCSYCGAAMDEDDVPLIMWSELTGDTCQFCIDCQSKWWGFER